MTPFPNTHRICYFPGDISDQHRAFSFSDGNARTMSKSDNYKEQEQEDCFHESLDRILSSTKCSSSSSDDDDDGISPNYQIYCVFGHSVLFMWWDFECFFGCK
ncbi:hypothetical protein CTI12_AA494070 [Artemisia annua]|uniref:Uncharacterized protein n=1 Tax=Artemisia annua TaxID=35608 RepID=A0A2U1LAB9_ARTAN|nr:hypothetical protein CTI12_AA494070 [Artemisia annua]